MEDILKEEFHCPVCKGQLREKRPKDRFIVVDKEQIVRLACICGYYRDIKVKPDDFKDVS